MHFKNVIKSSNIRFHTRCAFKSGFKDLTYQSSEPKLFNRSVSLVTNEMFT